MKASELLYVFALVACALLATATNQCGGSVDEPPPDDAGTGCICITCIEPSPISCDAPNAKPIEADQ